MRYLIATDVDAKVLLFIRKLYPELQKHKVNIYSLLEFAALLPNKDFLNQYYRLIAHNDNLSEVFEMPLNTDTVVIGNCDKKTFAKFDKIVYFQPFNEHSYIDILNDAAAELNDTPVDWFRESDAEFTITTIDELTIWLKKIWEII